MIKNLIWQEIQTIFIAALLAMLVWVYAEGENIRVHDLTLNLELTSPADRKLAIDPPFAQSVLVRVRCATAQFTALEEMSKKPFLLEVQDDPARPQQEINLLERLRNDRRFAEWGVVVNEVRAENPRVRIERLESRSLDVVALAGNLDVSGAVAIDPANATLLVPASRTAAVQQAKLVVHLDAIDTRNLPENVELTRELPIGLPDNLDIPQARIEPRAAKVTFTIRKRIETIKIDQMPILVVLPSSETERFAVHLGDEHRFIRDVQASGPRDGIERLRSKEVKPWAALILTPDELERGIASKNVEPVNLPLGVILTSPVPSIPFTIIKKSDVLNPVRPPERSPDRTPDRTPERSPDRAPERIPDRP